MKRTVVYLLSMALFLSACIPALPSLGQPEEAPAVDVQATDAALAETLAVETLNALPTPTLEPATAARPRSRVCGRKGWRMRMARMQTE